MTPKSFFGFFGGKGEGDDVPKAGEAQAEKRREVRLDVGEPALIVEVDIPGDAAPVTAVVVNVSARGLRLKMEPAARKRLAVGADLTGRLQLDGHEVRVALRVVRLIGESDGGFRIRPPFPKEIERLERFLEPRFLGKSLREIDPKVLQGASTDDRRMRWFQGLNDTNLFSWEDAAGAVVHQQLLFLERVIEWDLGAELKTGRVRGEGPGLQGWVKADLLEFDGAPDGELLGQARVLLASASIDDKTKGKFIARLG